MQTDSQQKLLRDTAQISVLFFRCGVHAAGVHEFCDECLRIMAQHAGVRDAMIVHGEQGAWQAVAGTGASGVPPERLLADAADAEQLRQNAQWWVIPLNVPGDAGWILAVAKAGSAADAAQHLELLASAIGAGLAAALRMQRAEARLKHLDSILDLSARWQSLADPDELIREIAQSSRELFRAGRATVYLWDRKRNVLVGTCDPSTNNSPTFEVPDNRGAVGQVFRTGWPVRSDASVADARNATDGARDAAMAADAEKEPRARATGPPVAAGNARAASHGLLCVPLKGRRGRLLGALELCHPRDGVFDAQDEAGLIEFAAHAAVAIENSRGHRDPGGARSARDGHAATRTDLIGPSPQIQMLRAKVLRVASSELPVLVLGENGSGKEIVSRMIHENSARRDKVFVAVNCAALAESLLEAELFGHEKGAYTDAHETRPGKFEAAADGTLFLDEIGELSPRAQAQLLRVLDEKAFTRVGGANEVFTNARLVAATNRPLAQMVQENKFREDLFFRLNVVTLEVPPLRERTEDILPLAEHFMAQFALRSGRDVPQLTPAAQHMLRAYRWPGNVRELRNLMERAIFLCASAQIDVADLGGLTSGSGPGRRVGAERTLADATREFQVQYIQQQIDAAGGSMTEAARRLGLHRSNLYRKMRQLDLPTEDE